MTDVFISYSRDDREQVRAIAEALTREGLNVWWDPEIPPGKTFSEVIDQHLNDADVVIAVWSSASIRSNWVQEEADDGLSRGRLIPIMIEPVELPRGFKRVQTADLTNWRGDPRDPQWRLVLSEVRRHVSAPARKTTQAPKQRAARPAGDANVGEAPQRKKSGVGGLVVAVVLLAGVGGGAYYFLTQPEAPSLAALMPQTSSAEAAALAPGETLKDCDACPPLVVIPPGEFVFGAPPDETSHEKTETPQVPITIAAPFALGVHEVTFSEWAACVADGGCDGFSPADYGWGGGDQPVVGVTFERAEAYLAWLSAKTGESYRLPSEAEWEYAARAGADSPFSFGEKISTRNANFNGQYPYAGGRKESSRGKPLPVGSFAANDFGLYDMHGNVWEWTADCWRASHAGALTDAAPVAGQCRSAVVKGGAWNSGAWRLRAAHRRATTKSDADYDTGFRVLRELKQ